MRTFLHMAYVFFGCHFLLLKAGELYELINGSPIIETFSDLALCLGLMTVPVLGFLIIVEHTVNPKYHK